MKYTSPNGYTGVMKKGNFMGWKHWDFTILKDGKMIYHATLSEPYSEEELKKHVDGFPEFYQVYQMLCKSNWR